MGFHVFKCTIEVIPVPVYPSGGGGGHVTTRGYNVPMRQKPVRYKKELRFTLKMGDKTWKITREVEERSADVVIKVAKFIDRFKKRVSIKVDSIKRFRASITAVFTKDDK